jgi:hypothetical protein
MESLKELQMQSGETFSWASEAFYLRTLNAMGKLKPMPELFWRVDRDLEEYNRRLGVDMGAVLQLQAMARPGKKTLLEFGPGSGVAKHDRQLKGVAGEYQDFSMSDAVYYDLSSPIGKLIDFERLSRDCGSVLSAEEQRSIAEYVTKALVIEAGKTAENAVAYDGSVRQAIERNPNALKELLPMVGPRLERAEVVPTSQAVEYPDGPHYEEKFVVRQQPETWQRARELLISNLGEYLRSDIRTVDVYELLGAHPAGTIVGDFSEIKKLRDEQLDLALGVRSTVYVGRDRYPEFMTDVVRKLKIGGIYIDDNVRENFGRYYRLAELQQVQETLHDLANKGIIPSKPEVYVVLGAGVEGEDFKKTDAPLSVIIHNGPLDDGKMAGVLQPGCRLVRLDDVTGDSTYLQSLDAEGNVLHAVTQRKQTTQPGAFRSKRTAA